MPWIVFAVTVWLLSLFLLRSRGLKIHWTAGAWSLLVGFFMTETLLIRNNIIFSQGIYLFQGIPTAYLVGLAGLGLLMIRFLPAEKAWQLPYLLVITALLTWVEIVLINNGLIIIEQWSLYDTFSFKLIALVSITWLSQLTVREKKGYLF